MTADPLLREKPAPSRDRRDRMGHDGDRARAQDAGFDAYVTKPADPDVM